MKWFHNYAFTSQWKQKVPDISVLFVCLCKAADRRALGMQRRIGLFVDQVCHYVSLGFLLRAAITRSPDHPQLSLWLLFPLHQRGLVWGGGSEEGNGILAPATWAGLHALSPSFCGCSFTAGAQWQICFQVLPGGLCLRAKLYLCHFGTEPRWEKKNTNHWIASRN